MFEKMEIPEYLSHDEDIVSLSKNIEELHSELKSLTTASEQEKSRVKNIKNELNHLKCTIKQSQDALNTNTSDIEHSKSLLEISYRHSAKLAKDVEQQQSQQVKLDNLALKLETDCLKAEDAIDAFVQQQNCTRQDLVAWTAAEHEQQTHAAEIDQANVAYSKQIKSLYRMLELSSQEASIAEQQSNTEQSSAKASSQQFEAALAALHDAQDNVYQIRRQWEDCTAALALRDAALLQLNGDIDALKNEITTIQKLVCEKESMLMVEKGAEKYLQRALSDIERETARLNSAAVDMKSLVESLNIQNQRGQSMLDIIQRDAIKKSCSRRDKAVANAQEEAQNTVLSLKQQHDLELTLNTIQNNALGSSNQRTVLSDLVENDNSRLIAAQKELDGIEKQLVAKENESNAVDQHVEELRIRLKNFSNQEKALSTRILKQQNEIHHHEEVLYHLKYECIVGKHRMLHSKNVDSSPADLRRRKALLFDQLNEITIQHKKAQQKRDQAEKDRANIQLLLKSREECIAVKENELKTASMQLQHSNNALNSLLQQRDTLQLAVDRLSLHMEAANLKALEEASHNLEIKKIQDTTITAVQHEIDVSRNKLEEIHQGEIAATKELHDLKVQLNEYQFAVNRVQAQHAVFCMKSSPSDGSGDMASSHKIKDLVQQIKEIEINIHTAQQELDILTRALDQHHAVNASMLHKSSSADTLVSSSTSLP